MRKDCEKGLTSIQKRRHVVCFPGEKKKEEEEKEACLCDCHLNCGACQECGAQHGASSGPEGRQATCEHFTQAPYRANAADI